MNFLSDILTLKNKLFRTALRITLNRQEAEDIVQQTLIKVWQRGSSDTPLRSVEAYAYTICRNLALDYVRTHARPHLSLDTATTIPLPSSDDPLEHLARQERLTAIALFIDTLPEKQRTCMQLRDIEGLPYKDIAAILSLSEEQVKINIFRARKAVKDHFTQ